MTGHLRPHALERPITVAVTRAVPGGRHEDAVDWLRQGQNLAQACPGFLGSGWVRSTREPNLWHVLYRFATQDELAVWEESGERRSWLAKGKPFIVEAPETRRTTTEMWFEDSPKPDIDMEAHRGTPHRWKQMMTIFLPFLPLSLAMTYLLAWLGPEWPLWLRSLVSVSVLTPAMTYIFLPWTTRLLRRWL